MLHVEAVMTSLLRLQEFGVMPIVTHVPVRLLRDLSKQTQYVYFYCCTVR